jgi:hypothetical protein
MSKNSLILRHDPTLRAKYFMRWKGALIEILKKSFITENLKFFCVLWILKSWKAMVWLLLFPEFNNFYCEVF